MRGKRLSLDQQAISQTSFAACQHFLRSALFRKSKHIAGYLPFRNELDTQFIIEACWRHGKYFYLPMIHPFETRLWFTPYFPNTQLTHNQHGILEPTTRPRHPLPARYFDVVLTPLVAFDKLGNRLGSGAGYYDRSFAFKQQMTGTKPYLLGLAYSWQQVDNLPTESWDIPLNGIITEQAMRELP